MATLYRMSLLLIIIRTIERERSLPAVQAELTEPAETTALGGRTFLFWKTSTRRGTHSSFCSLWPSLTNQVNLDQQ